MGVVMRKMALMGMVAILLSACGSGGGDPTKSAQKSYCERAMSKVELCFGSLSNYGLDVNQEVNACANVTCPGASEETWQAAEQAVIGLSCSELEEFLELALSGESGAGCF